MTRLITAALALSMFGPTAHAGKAAPTNVKYALRPAANVPTSKRTWKREVWGMKTASRAAVTKEMTSALQAKFGTKSDIKIALVEPHGTNYSFRHGLSIPESFGEITVDGERKGEIMADATKGKVQVVINPGTFEFENRLRAARGMPSVQHDLERYEAEMNKKSQPFEVGVHLNVPTWMDFATNAMGFTRIK